MKALSYKQRVAKGAKLLDECLPGWERRVTPGALDIASDINCVLGQVFGDYFDGIEFLRGEDPIIEVHYSANRGFNLYVSEFRDDDGEKANKWLVRRWIEEVNSRVAA